jgi:hypothetical protein
MSACGRLDRQNGHASKNRSPAEAPVEVAGWRRKMNKKVLALTIFTLFSANALADASFLCVTDVVSGLHHDEDRDNWEHASFLPGERFAINERRKDVYEVERLGVQRTWPAICTARTDQTDDSFSCAIGTDQFHFNRKLLRFTSVRYFGYWNGSTDSLSISIGTCFPN